MTKIKFLTAAAVVSGLVATPVFAKDMTRRAQMADQGYSASMDDGMRDSRATYQTTSYRGDGYRDSGFWPGDVAAGAVGGAIGIAGAAVGTAGAIATAPFQPNGWNNSYASYNGYYDGGLNSSGTRVPQDSYAQRNGWVCQPGTWIRGEDGRRHICQ